MPITIEVTPCPALEYSGYTMEGLAAFRDLLGARQNAALKTGADPEHIVMRWRQIGDITREIKRRILLLN